MTDAPTAPETDTLTDPETESETEAETKDYTSYTAHASHAFLYDLTGASAPQQIKGNRTAGTHIRVGADSYLSTITAACPSWGDSLGSMELTVYRWNTDHATMVASEPVFRYTIENHMDNSWVTVKLPDRLIGEGEWYYEYANGSNNAIGVNLSTGKVEATEDGVISVVDGYVNGRSGRKMVQSYATYTRYEEGATPPTPGDPNGYTKLTEGKAHVIICCYCQSAQRKMRCAFPKPILFGHQYTGH